MVTAPAVVAQILALARAAPGMTVTAIGRACGGPGGVARRTTSDILKRAGHALRGAGRDPLLSARDRRRAPSSAFLNSSRIHLTEYRSVLSADLRNNSFQ
jgi:hypothetical protein